jgi:hypothetical protein
MQQSDAAERCEVVMSRDCRDIGNFTADSPKPSGGGEVSARSH